MKNLKSAANLQLLYEVRKDALIKSSGELLDNDLFILVSIMLDLFSVACREGILSMDEAVQNISSDFRFYTDVQTAVFYSLEGMDMEELIEVLTADYWNRNLQGQHALAYYIIILSAVRIWDGDENNMNPHALEKLLIANFSPDNRERYFTYKRQQEGEEPSPLERFLNNDSSFGVGDGRRFLVAQQLIEEKIQNATEEQIKKVIRCAEETDIIMAFKGMSIASKRKLCSAMPRHRAEKYAIDCEYMGPVRAVDVMGSFLELVAIFESETESNE